MHKLVAKIGPSGLFLLTTALGCGGSGRGSTPPAAPEPEAAAVAPSPASEPTPPAEPSPATTEPSVAPRAIEVPLQAKSGAKLSGKAVLTETPEGVKVTISVQNVAPGDHGAHIHEHGDCSAADASSAGGHFNPAGHPHALPSTSPRHLGDLGNLTVGQDGTGAHEALAEGANLLPEDPRSFVGRAIVIHEKKDDGGQPVGNAGGRIGCGEIKWVAATVAPTDGAGAHAQGG